MAVAPLIYVAALLGIWWIDEAVEVGGLGGWWFWLEMLLLILALVGPVVALVCSGIGGHRAFRHWRRAHGYYTKKETADVLRESSSAKAWEAACALKLRLARREVPESIRIWDVVANAGEVFFLDVPADYARHYGMDVTYSQSAGNYFGRPSFVLAGLGAQAMSNAARRNAAANQAAAQWRERQPCRLVVSNQRLLCQVGGRWLSFHFSAVTAVYPEIGDWSLITQYESTSPLLLIGVHVPSAALLTVLAALGPEAIGAHPSLRMLDPNTVSISSH